MGWKTLELRSTRLVLTGFTFLLFGAVHSEAATVEFRGGGTLSDYSNGCSIRWPVGGSSAMTARFRPPKLGDNGPSTRLAFFFPIYATSFVLESGKLTGKFKQVTGGSTASGTYQYDITSKMKVTNIVPSKINANTTDILIEGTIKGFDWLQNCQVNFSVRVSRRP